MANEKEKDQRIDSLSFFLLFVIHALVNCLLRALALIRLSGEKEPMIA